MIIGSKCSLIREQLNDRREKNVKFVEIQLTLGELDDVQSTFDKKFWLKENGITAYAVHPPISNSRNEDCSLVDLRPALRKENLSILKKTIMIANRICEVANPVVVLHVGGLMDEGVFIPDFIKKSKEIFKGEIWEIQNYVASHCPKVVLAIENNPATILRGGKSLQFGYGYEDDLVHWVRELKDSHVGNAFSVSSAMESVAFNVRNNPKSDFRDFYSLFESYISTLKLVRFSNGNHLPFSPESTSDLGFVREFMAFTNKIRYTNPITINVEEKDDCNAVNFSLTRSAVVKAFSRG